MLFDSPGSPLDACFGSGPSFGFSSALEPDLAQPSAPTAASSSDAPWTVTHLGLASTLDPVSEFSPFSPRVFSGADPSLNASPDWGALVAGLDPYFLQPQLDHSHRIQSTQSHTAQSSGTLPEPSTTPTPIEDLAGNHPSEARDILLGSTFGVYRDWVGQSDRNDYYRFSVPDEVSFSLTLSGLTADADVQVLNANRQFIYGSFGFGSNTESISQELPAGTYYIRVYAYSGETAYTLKVQANPLALTDGFNAVSGYGLVNGVASLNRALELLPPLVLASGEGVSESEVGPGVSSAAEPNPADSLGPSLNSGWEADLIQAPSIWAQGYRGQGVIVAVVDTGVDISHSDLQANSWTNLGEIAGNGLDDDGNGYIDDVQGWDFVDGDNAPLDTNGHGTHVAGAIAAANNGVGSTGIAPGARILPVRVLGPGGGTASQVAAGIRYAVDNGARIINLSLGGGYSSTIETAIAYANERGAIVVMAAGNESASRPGYPAQGATQWGLVVGAVDRNTRFASFSNRAGKNSQMAYVVAPGVNVYSTLPGDRYGYLSGTSMATPQVSGLIALMLSANPALTPTQVRQILTTTATALGGGLGPAGA